MFNQFPSNVMFDMKGFYVSASEAIQGHHGPLVLYYMKKIYQTGSAMEAFADNKYSCLIKGHAPVGRVEKIVGKGGNISLYQHFLLFPQYFPKVFVLKVVKT